MTDFEVANIGVSLFMHISVLKWFLGAGRLIVASLRLKNEIGERQDSLRRLG